MFYEEIKQRVYMELLERDWVTFNEIIEIIKPPDPMSSLYLSTAVNELTSERIIIFKARGEGLRGIYKVNQ